MKRRIYLVTGAAGFIGSSIVEELLRRGEKVRAIDNFSTGKKQNIAPHLSEIEFIEGDIGNLKLLASLMHGVDYVLHQAAIPSVPRSVEDPLSSNNANVAGTLNVLVCARDAKVKRVVYASSSSVYGNSLTLPKQEDMAANPLSPYAISKYAAELYCRVFYKVYGLETVCLRYFNVFGPKQDPTSQYSAAIPKFISSICRGNAPVVHGDGLQTRDFTYIDNVVEANLLAATAGGVAGDYFNIACGERISIKELVDRLIIIIGRKIEIVYDVPRSADVKHSLADITKAKMRLGYSVKVNVLAGLEKVVKWYLESQISNGRN